MSILSLSICMSSFFNSSVPLKSKFIINSWFKIFTELIFSFTNAPFEVMNTMILYVFFTAILELNFSLIDVECVSNSDFSRVNFYS